MKWLLTDEDFSAACSDREWMIEVLWNNGIISEEHAKMIFIYGCTDYDAPNCPFCGAQDHRHYHLSDRLWKCKKCKKKFSITSGRYIDNSKIPISYWWRFCWLVAELKILNSAAIARDLEITQKSAWLMIDTLKRSMKDAGIKLENGVLGINNCYDAVSLLMKVVKQNIYDTSL